MTGLFDTFWRHFALLTNFTGNEVDSRPFARGGRSWSREGPAGGPTGPGGWDQGRTGERGSVRVQDVRTPEPTHSSPYRASGARSAGSGVLLEQLDPWRWVPVLPLPVPTRYTPPLYPPGPHPAADRHHEPAVTPCPGPPARVHMTVSGPP